MNWPFDRPYFNIVVLRAPLHAVVHAIEVHPMGQVEAAPTPFVFPAQPSGRAKVTIPMLLWTPRAAPRLTAFMPGVASGDYFVAARATCFKYELIEVRTSSIKSEQVQEFVAHAGGRKIRVVQALQDSPRWVFYEDGAPLPFEDVASYGARFVRDRLKREAVLSYAESWGAPVRDTSFWATDEPAWTFKIKASAPDRRSG